MAFTYISLLPEVIPFGVYAETAELEQPSVSEYHPIEVYTALYDDTNIPNGYPFHKRTDGYISGTTIDETNGVIGSVAITCLWNKNLKIVATDISDPTTGTWTVRGLDPDDTYGYTIIAQDPVTGTVYNSVSYDKIIPAAPV